MDTFLNKVAKDILLKTDNIGGFIFVLPNQRAGIYLKKYLKRQIDKTVFFPEIITFDNLAEQISGIPKINAVNLLFEFYRVYQEETKPQDIETFDSFSNWAYTVLSDFNEIDAYLIDPTTIFNNLKSLNHIQNWDPNTELTKNYLSFFQKIKTYHRVLYQKLLQNQKGYQGLILKEAVGNLQYYIANSQKQFVFAGFNHLKNSESQIVQELLEANKASIYWDISEDILSQNNLASHFIKKYQEEWPYYIRNTFNWVTKSSVDYNKIKIIGVPKNVGMIKYAGELIKNSSNQNNTAFVLANQNLLPIALNSLPDNLEKVNITMGLPLRNLPFSDLVKALIELHINARTQKNTIFYYKMVFKIFQHAIIKTHFNAIDIFIENLKDSNKTYFDINNILSNLKSANIKDYKILSNLFDADNNSISNLLENINSLILYLKNKMHGIDREIVFKHYKLNNQLLLLINEYPYFKEGLGKTNPIKSFYQIYQTLLSSENLNFIGEPLEGLQIMGFLETQSLEFEHLILTSANEGVLPQGKRSKSFIPYDIRSHFGLLTYHEKNAIDAYYFYRLINSCGQISILYNTETDSFGGGEKSQFITQLLWKFPNIKESFIYPNVKLEAIKNQYIAKSPEILNKLIEIAKKGFSPSALTSYIYNPIQFYQQRILNIDILQEVEETIADNTMGTVIHETLEKLYQRFIGSFLSVKSLNEVLKLIPKQVKTEFANNFKNGQYDYGKNRLIYEVVVRFVTRFIKNEIQSIKSGKKIKIIALELPMSSEIQFSKFNFPIKFKGIIDRVDEVDGILRIIDYKSGKVTRTQMRVGDLSLFISDYKYAKAFQVLLYTFLYTKHTAYDKKKNIQAGVVSFKNLNAGFIPVNFTKKKNEIPNLTSDNIDSFMEIVQNLLLLIFDQNIPFTAIDK
jgi:hypothetical protein